MDDPDPAARREPAASAPAGADRTAVKLDDTRRSLLDLTRRNRLLNHNPRAATNVRVVGEEAAELLRLLLEEKTLTFLAREEAPPEIREALEAYAAEDRPRRTADAGGPSRLPSLPPDRERARDRRLQTALDGPELQERLLRLEREARSALQEQGANILYLTLGMLTWRDPRNPDERSRAPLLFVPLEIFRTSAHARHAVRLFDDEVATNPNLAELAARRYGVKLPIAEVGEGFDVKAYFAEAKRAIEPLEGWTLDETEVHVGVFSFAKLLMYRDLDTGSWPGERRLEEHPLVRCLLGEGAPGGAPAPPEPRRAERDAPLDAYPVVDADSSQQAAIQLCKEGASCVVEGPPGTGKSQTITNLIAEFLGQGKTVLFVAEKAAALDVVKRRLEKAGLGEFVLDLHSRHANKTRVLEGLRQALEAEPAAGAAPSPPDGRLAELRAELDRYVEDLHAPLGALGISPREAIARSLAFEGAPAAAFSMADPLALDGRALSTLTEALDAVDRRLALCGDPAASPWRGTAPVRLSLTAKEELEPLLTRAARGLDAARAASAALDAGLGLDASTGPGALAARAAAARELASSPVIPEAWLADARLDDPPAELAGGVSAGIARRRCQEQWKGVFVPGADDLDWRAVFERRRVLATTIFRFLSPRWHADSRAIEARLLPGVKLDLARQLDLLPVLAEGHKQRVAIEASGSVAGAILGAAWRGLDTDFAAVSAALEAARSARRLAASGLVSASAAKAILTSSSRDAISSAASAADRALAAFHEAWRAMVQTLTIDEAAFLGAPVAGAPWDAVSGALLRARGALDTLDDWAAYQSALAGVRTAAPWLAEWLLTPDAAAARGRLGAAFQRRFLRLWIAAAFERRPSLERFRAEDHEAKIARFRELDTAWLDNNRRRLASLLRSRRPERGLDPHRASQLGILLGELRKKRRSMSLRRLLAQAPDAIRALKPCFMMSPISVALYLEPGSVEFDAVVFDEASQVEPADALGAIARGRQVILVGDERQLPPTSFFKAVESPASETGGEELRATDLESILGLGAVRLPQAPVPLRWHYRSRHASLIEFSNAQFYEGRLRVFPSPHTGRGDAGVAFDYVENGLYRRGEGQDNPVEARAVAQAVADHAKLHPVKSLGVGAFSVQQQHAIEDEVEAMLRSGQYPELEAFVEAHPDEPFFVKNLETIQGDERDSIFLSIGYGKDREGKLWMNFGPLSLDGGWRRLNVLVTRARERCVVFSSIRAADLRVQPATPRGVAALRDYLQFAEAGSSTAAEGLTSAQGSAIEEAIARGLRDRGLDIRPGVGASGFRLDAAVADPVEPGRFRAGVVADGGAYAASATARDRDRLTDSVLTALGWRLARVWTPDWYRNPGTVLDRLAARLTAIPKDAPPPAVAPAVPPAPTPSRAPATAAEPPAAAAAPYVRIQRRAGDAEQLHTGVPVKTAEVLRAIVETEGPVHADEASRVLASLFGTRVSPRSTEAFERALAVLTASGPVVRRGEFLWLSSMTAPAVRDRSGACPVKDPDLVAPEEFEAAALLALVRQYGIPREALAEAALRAMGFSRTTPRLLEAAGAAVERLVAAGRVVAAPGGHLAVQSP